MDFMSGSGGTQVLVDVTGDDSDAIAEGADQVIAAIKPVKDVAEGQDEPGREEAGLYVPAGSGQNRTAKKSLRSCKVCSIRFRSGN